jgi:hypothetical protein
VVYEGGSVISTLKVGVGVVDVCCDELVDETVRTDNDDS